MAEEATETAQADKSAEPKSAAKAEAPSKDKTQKMEIPTKFKDLVKSIEALSVLELSELVKVLEGHFGVSAAAQVAAPVVVDGGAGETAAEAKSSYTIMLSASGDQKINVIKAVREITGLGLAESKALVDSAPKAVKENVPTAEAEEAKKTLEAAGATVELQ